MIKNLRKRGFTIVELVIVIAVIAILAAILIPTFSGIIKKANIASDTAMAKNMNTALVMADSEGNVPEDMGDVLFILYEAGYALENLNPTTNGYYFVWDSSTNQILFLTDTFEVHYNSKSYSEDTLDWYMPVDEASDVINGQEFSYTMADDLTASFTFDYLANFDTNGFYLDGNLTYDSTDAGEFTVSGMINGALNVNTPSATLHHFGSVDNVVITAIASASYHEFGFIKQVLKAVSGRVVIENTGNVTTIKIAGTTLSVVNEGYISEVDVEDTGESGLTVDEINAAAALIVNNGLISDFSAAVTAAVTSGSTVTLPSFSETSTNEVGEADGFTINIDNLNQLESFRDSVNQGMYSEGLTIKLTSDIDLTGIAWTPIGAFPRDANPDKGFKGIFDGGNHKIIGLSNKGYTVKPLSLNQNNTTPGGYKEIIYGFFGVIMNQAQVKNIEFTNVDIDIPTTNETLGDSVAAAVGFAGPKGAGSNIIIDNIKVSGQIKAYDSPAGIIGRSYASTTTIKNCVNNANIISIRKAAGILGGNYSAGTLNLENCTNNGDVTSQADKEGTNDVGGKGTGYYIASGIFNSNGGTANMKNCKNYGDISASITVNKLTNHSSLKTDSDASNVSFIFTNINEVIIAVLVQEYNDAASAAAFVTLLNANELGLVLTDYDFLSNEDKTVVGEAMLTVGVFADKAEVQLAATMAIDEIISIERAKFSGGIGTIDNPYQVSNAEQLDNVRNFLDKSFIQTADINLGVDNWIVGEGWVPIGAYISLNNSAKAFKGTYNGDGKIISGLTIDTLNDYQGLFGYITESSTLTNIKLSNVNIHGEYGVGSLVGQSKGIIIGCSSSGFVSGDSNVGGLIGSSTGRNALIEKSSSSANVSGTTKVGGVVGKNGDYYGGIINTSYATGNVIGENYVGGLIGEHANASITNCYATGSVTGIGHVGGLAGYAHAGNYDYCYAVGLVVGDTNTQGLFGDSNQGYPHYSYYDSTTTNQTGGKGIPKSTLNMVERNLYINSPWDFDNIWVMNDFSNPSYPYFKWQTDNIPLANQTVVTAQYDERLTTAIGELESVVLSSYYGYYIYLPGNYELSSEMGYEISVNPHENNSYMLILDRSPGDKSDTITISKRISDKIIIRDFSYTQRNDNNPVINHSLPVLIIDLDDYDVVARKVTAKEELNTYVNSSDYTRNATALSQAIATGIDNISLALKVTSVEVALANAKAEINLIQTDAELALIELNAATAAVIVAENTLLDIDKASAQILVSGLPNGENKNSLQTRLNVIFTLQDLAAIEDATSLVENAEISKLQSDVDLATDACNGIRDGNAKDNLFVRLREVQDIIDVRNAKAALNLTKANTCSIFSNHGSDYIGFKVPESTNGVMHTFDMVATQDGYSDTPSLFNGLLTINGYSVRYRYYTLTVSITKGNAVMSKAFSVVVSYSDDITFTVIN